MNKRRAERADDVRQFDLLAAAIVADGLTVHREAMLADKAMLHEFVDDRGDAAGMVIVFAEIFARRLKIHEKRHLVPVGLPIVYRQLDPDVTRDCREMDGRIRRSADGGA